MAGSDVVDWLYHHVEGFTDRRESRKYASNLLKAGYIRHTVNKITFSEQCYYIFGDLCGSMWDGWEGEDGGVVVLQSPADTTGTHLQPLLSGWAPCSTDPVKRSDEEYPSSLVLLLR